MLSRRGPGPVCNVLGPPAGLRGQVVASAVGSWLCGTMFRTVRGGAGDDGIPDALDWSWHRLPPLRSTKHHGCRLRFMLAGWLDSSPAFVAGRSVAGSRCGRHGRAGKQWTLGCAVGCSPAAVAVGQGGFATHGTRGWRMKAWAPGPELWIGEPHEVLSARV